MPPVHELDTNLDEYAKAGLSAVVVFPFVTSEAGIVEVLSALRTGSPRWKVRNRGGPTGVVHVAVEWSTASGDVSDTMGFAPLLSMPVPRRAPYFAIGAWPGGRSNPLRGVPPTPRARSGVVSFLAVAHELETEAYAKMWSTTEGGVNDLMTLPADNAALYRRVAFVLDASVASAITYDP